MDMVEPTRVPLATWQLTLHTVLLVAANALLAAVLALVVLGPTLAVIAGMAVIGLMLMAAPIRSRQVLRQQGAVVLPADHWVSRVVATLGVRAGLKRAPQAWLLPQPVANAMAVGDGDDGGVAITEGALQHLSDEELGGVLAHEVAHLAHGDTRLMAMTAMAGSITGILSQIAIFMILLSLPLMLVGVVSIHPLLLVMVFTAPLAAQLLQLALSRTREFAADRRAVALVGSPHGLSRALQRIEAGMRRRMPPWLAPYVTAGHPWLRSHPPTELRVRELEAMPMDNTVPPLPTRRRHTTSSLRLGPISWIRRLFGRQSGFLR